MCGIWGYDISNYRMDPVKQISSAGDMENIQGGRGDFHNLVDILFVLDTTGSMGWCIRESIKTIKKIITKFSSKQYNIEFALSLYRDHPPQQYSYVTKHYNLTGQEQIVKTLDEKVKAAGGGDTPEAVMDGLFEGIRKTHWRIGNDGKTRSKRFLFHCCDAPPHGTEYCESDSVSEWNKGCPCGTTRMDIKQLLQKQGIDYSLIKVGSAVQVMESLFKECFANRFKRVMKLEVHQQKRTVFKDKAPKRKGSFDSEQEGSLEQCQMDECEMEQDDEDLEHKAEEKLDKGIERKRSMASLVCSEVESGLSDYEREIEEANKDSLANKNPK